MLVRRAEASYISTNLEMPGGGRRRAETSKQARQTNEPSKLSGFQYPKTMFATATYSHARPHSTIMEIRDTILRGL